MAYSGSAEAPSFDSSSLIDLRSDTVTRPTSAMRAAMAAAEVGDDIYGEDPTINRLEARAAEIFGREAAVFVPSGTMGNQIALRLHTRPNQEIICESRAHILDWEMAMAATFSGCLIRAVASPAGYLTWEQIAPVVHAKGSTFSAATGLIELENTANLAGGIVIPLPVMEEVLHEAHKRNLPVHLDGARIFNAATTLGGDIFENVRTLTRSFDTVMFCLSKGLCAPVGSMLVGSKDAIDEARVYRKALGGAMRQAGVLAAAGLIALEEMTLRLHEDHANAKLLAESLAKLPEVQIDPATVETNIVIFNLNNRSAAEVTSGLKARGVLAGATGPKSVRLVTHHDVDRNACLRAAEILGEVLEDAAVAARS
ncbi:threonine aldolase family protein [Acidicapsa dinghuensis]|uniref:Threonine aldolase family protein n=1 Tax=Acidicapsa dinghuensis TaxID=2218256 RepID=A0ABW1EIA8_9BACT|nr:GntG family PLP-dependent aldolase [Acidicapsa dinghuensis]